MIPADTFVGTTRAGASALARKGYEMSEDKVQVPREIVDFMLGMGPLDGSWFGDDKGRRGAFWWREHLAAAVCNAAPNPGQSPSPSDVERVAINLAKADGKKQGNTYALTAYRAGVDMTIDYWNTLARAALASMVSPAEAYLAAKPGARLRAYAESAALSAMPNPKGNQRLVAAIDSLTSWLLHRFGPNSPEGREAMTCRHALTAAPDHPDDISTGQGEEQ